MNWGYLTWTIGLAAASLVASIGIIAALLVSLPPSFFLDTHVRQPWMDRHKVIRISGLIIKNFAGLLLILLGGILSIPGIPGQGLLTILIGLVLLDFPGKRRFERAILARPHIHRSVNRLRARFGKRPLLLDDVD